jgi:hypothetical protein
MKMEITAQQTAFFTQNGYIELGGIDLHPELFLAEAKKILDLRCKTPQLRPIPAEELYLKGRDLWRESELLKKTLLQKLFPVISALSSKKLLRLACDQWIFPELIWKKSCSLKDLFSIQGLVLGALFSSATLTPSLKNSLGLLPLPSQANNILFFKPHLLLDWPQLIQSAPSDLYLIAYALPNAVYIKNSLDPATHYFKQFGYNFGDLLKNEFHPLCESK